MTANARRSVIREVTNESRQSPSHVNGKQSLRLPELFGCNVFSDAVQRQRLSRAIYKALRATIESGAELTPGVADAIANAMKDWATERGATHYTHWFQPMTGLTAEKHDSFISQTADGRVMLEFSGTALIQGEPDASSFPSGGIRATFEARGYTAWDPTSPAFLRETDGGATLCIPTAFCSWTGEALDKKTPLLRAGEVLSRQAVRLLHLLGETQVSSVYSTVGSEQEYFLIDRRFFFLRPDLVACDRTLFGARPPKGQELEDHYFGAISQRVLRYMMELERELWKLGIPIRTRHNEVAPGQYELAPVFEHAVVSTDHNMLTMELMKILAARHGLACLLHEKPFAGINGSGKHNNWSMSDNHGNNLLEPGKTPHENLMFMVFLTAILRAVDMHQDLLRASIAHSGNDHRLGANEAPPAIVSVYVGSQLEEIIENLIEGTAPRARGGESLRLGVNTLPALPRDFSDRNRTSPFAFTGNKFEFRAVGSSQSIANPNMVLNTIVAESLDYIATEIESRNGKGQRTEVIAELVREILTKHRRILFSGDNYSEQWVQEAERRGLLNLKETPSALASWTAPKNEALFARYGVLNSRETHARSSVYYNMYSHRLNVEALSMLEIASTSILPVAIGCQKRVADSIKAVSEVSPKIDLRSQLGLLEHVSAEIGRLQAACERLRVAQKEAEHGSGSHQAKAESFRDNVLPAMQQVRSSADVLEGLVEDDLWPLPKYRELLFIS